MKVDYRLIAVLIIAIAVLVRIFLLFLAPISMFADPVIRFLPYAEKVLHLDFNFHDFPLLIILEAFWMLFLSGNLLWIALKSTSLIFFMATLFLLPNVFRRFNLNKKEQLIALALFLFSTWSLLLSVTIMQEVMLAFFVLALFLSVENYFDNPNVKWVTALVILTALMIFAKQTGYIIMIGFGLCILCKKSKWKIKIKSFFCLAVGVLLTVFWPIKNYMATGRALIGASVPSVALHGLREYWDSFIIFYHYFWEIPLPVKTEFAGILASMYNLYYLAAILATAAVSMLIILALFKYGKKYKEHILLMLPLFGFALIYWTFLSLRSGDAGRYTFPLWIFLFIFTAKLIAAIKNSRIRQICYFIVALFCIISIISAFGIVMHMHSIDGQILSINDALRQQNAMGTFITNDEFTSSALSYYLKQRVVFNMTRNVRDNSIRCSGEQVFFSKNFDVFKEGTEYKICRI